MQVPPHPAGPGAATERAGGHLLRQDREDCHRLDVSLTREWLEADGLGGYAASTVPLCPTRRQHGWLVAQPPGLARRHVFLSRLDETLVGPEAAAGTERSLALGVGRYPGLFQPQGHLGCEGFELAPWPSWTYRLGLARVTREILVPRGRRAVLVRYTNRGERAGLSLRLRPLLPYREADRLTQENFDFDQRARRLDGAVLFEPYRGLPPIAFAVAGTAARFEADPVWYRRIEYTADLAQGFDGHEDNASPGWFELPLPIGAEVLLAVSLGQPLADPAALWEAESARRQAEVMHLRGADGKLDLGAHLDLAAEAFLYREASGRLGVVAGYPWYGERARDTVQALPGLTAARGRVEDLGAALESLAGELRAGCLPEQLGPGAGSPRRDSADAALWFARAVRSYEQAGGSAERLDGALLPALEAMAQTYLDGASPLVCVDSAGLLLVGAPGLASTWMDAATADGPVTPRHGCPVEVQALWYQLLAVLEQAARRRGEAAREREWTKRKRLAGKSFLRRLWIEDGRYLADGWTPERGQDASVRANMVIAASLEFSPLTLGKRTDVLLRAEAELLTPFGLRSLAPMDPRYEGHHLGGPQERELARHQGSVWPWLLGAYAEGMVRVQGQRKRPLARLRASLDVFFEHLERQGLNQVSELFDGDPPHKPGGAFARAVNVAELLRAVRLLEGGRS